MNEETAAASKDSSALWEKKEFAERYLTQELRDERNRVAKRILELFPNPPEKVKRYINGEPEEGKSQIFNDGLLEGWLEMMGNRRWSSIEFLRLLDEGKFDELRTLLEREANIDELLRDWYRLFQKMIETERSLQYKAKEAGRPWREVLDEIVQGLSATQHSGGVI